MSQDPAEFYASLHQPSWKDTMVKAATQILGRVKTLGDFTKHSTTDRIDPGQWTLLVNEASTDVQEILQGLVSQLPVEGAEDDAWLARLLETRTCEFKVNMFPSRQRQGDPPLPLSAESSRRPSAVSAPREFFHDDDEAPDDDGSIQWMAAAARQRLAELHVQLANSKSMLRVARAKIKRRNMVLQYIQSTLYREVLYFHEQFLRATEHKDRIKDMDVGVFSFIDFLELLEDPGQDGADSEDVDDDLDFDAKLERDPVERRRKKLERARLKDPAKVDLVSELSTRWKHDKENGLVDGEGSEFSLRETFSVLQKKCTGFEKQINGMTSKYIEEITRVRAEKSKFEMGLHTTSNDLAFTLNKLEEVRESVDERNLMIKDLSSKVEEQENLMSLMQLSADSMSAEAKDFVSAQEGKLQTERMRIQKVLERLANSGLEVPPELLNGNDDDDDPMVVETLRSAQSMTEMKDALKAATGQLEPLVEELTQTKERNEMLERGVEVSIKNFKQLGLPLPEELHPFDVDGGGAGPDHYDPAMEVMRLTMEKDKVLTQVEDLIDTMKRGEVKLQQFSKSIHAEIQKRKEADVHSPSEGMDILTLDAAPSGFFSRRPSRESSGVHDPPSSSAVLDPPLTSRSTDAASSGESDGEHASLDRRVLVQTHALDEIVSVVENQMAEISDRLERDKCDGEKLRETVTEQRKEIARLKMPQARSPLALSGHLGTSQRRPNGAMTSSMLATSVMSTTTLDAGCQVNSLSEGVLASPKTGEEAPKTPMSASRRSTSVRGLSSPNSLEVPLTSSFNSFKAPPIVETRSRWIQTNGYETKTAKTQTDKDDTLDKTMKAAEEYMLVLEQQATNTGSSPMKTGVTNVGAGGRAPTSASGNDEAKMKEWLASRVVCDHCGASLRPQFLARVKYESKCTGPNNSTLLGKEETTQTEIGGGIDSAGGAFEAFKETTHSSGNSPSKQRQSRGEGAEISTQTNVSTQSVEVLCKPQIRSVLCGEGSRAVPGLGSRPGSSCSGFGERPGSVADLRRLASDTTPRHMDDGGGLDGLGQSPFMRQYLGDGMEGALVDISRIITVEEVGVQADMLDIPFADLPEVGARRHVTGKDKRKQRLRSAGTMSTRSSNCLDDDDDVSWSTDLPSRPASGFAGGDRRKTGPSPAPAPAHAPAPLRITGKRAATALHTRGKGPGAVALIKNSQSPPPPMFHHRFPGGKMPTIKPITQVDEEKVQQAFVQSFGAPLIEYKQLKTKKRQMLLLPPSVGQVRTSKKPVAELGPGPTSHSLLTIELRDRQRQAKELASTQQEQPGEEDQPLALEDRAEDP